MKKLSVIFFFLSLGCASTNVGRATQLVVASDSVADQVADAYVTFVDTRVASCDEKLDPEKNTKEEAQECLGLASSDSGEKLKVIMKGLVAAQLAIQIAVECETNPVKLPAEFRDRCVAGQKANWQALTSTLMDVVTELKPYFESVKGADK